MGRVVRDFVPTLSQRIRARRTYLAMTQAALAEAAGVSVELISRIERARCAPSVATLIQLSNVLETTPNDLLGYTQKAPEGDAAHIVEAFRVLPKPRRKELTRIAEALVQYERSSS